MFETFELEAILAVMSYRGLDAVQLVIGQLHHCGRQKPWAFFFLFFYLVFYVICVYTHRSLDEMYPDLRLLWT